MARQKKLGMTGVVKKSGMKRGGKIVEMTFCLTLHFQKLQSTRQRIGRVASRLTLVFHLGTQRTQIHLAGQYCRPSSWLLTFVLKN